MFLIKGNENLPFKASHGFWCHIHTTPLFWGSLAKRLLPCNTCHLVKPQTWKIYIGDPTAAPSLLWSLPLLGFIRRVKKNIIYKSVMKGQVKKGGKQLVKKSRRDWFLGAIKQWLPARVVSYNCIVCCTSNGSSGILFDDIILGLSYMDTYFWKHAI